VVFLAEMVATGGIKEFDSLEFKTMKTFYDDEQREWQVELISHGQTSGYLNQRVHKPVLQFSCLDATRSRRYLGYSTDGNTLSDLCEQELRELLARSSAH